MTDKEKLIQTFFNTLEDSKWHECQILYSKGEVETLYIDGLQVIPRSDTERTSMSVQEDRAALRARSAKCRQLSLQLAQAREARNTLALRLLDAGLSWREVADDAGFKNPYLADLKERAAEAGS